MILVGNARGGARNLALHLLKEENDHIELHEVRGFASDTLPEALNEAYALSRGTRCKQFLFSLSLNPPPGKNVPTVAFEAAIDRAEAELGLTGQPRVVVFHEKEGRRHAHAVWSRIDVERMKAIPLPYSKMRLCGVSRELFIEHGWRMPPGLADRRQRDPRNYSLAEYQQAKRAGRDTRDVKTAIQDAWAISDSKAAFIHALEERGYRLARGDRRGFVALDHTGEPYAIAKWAEVKTKAVRDRLGDEKKLASIEDVRREIARDMQATTKRLRLEQVAEQRKRTEEFQRQRAALLERQRSERVQLAERQTVRQLAEAKARQDRFAPGVRGLWNRLTGEHRRTKERNEREAYAAFQRDRWEKDDLIFAHIEARTRLNVERTQGRAQRTETRQALRQEFRDYAAMEADPREEARRAFREKRQTEARQQTRRREGPAPSR